VDPRELNLANIDLNQLVALQALLDTASVSRAAKRLGITQSAMSHTLRRLRELFGDPLLVRGSGGMVLTPRATTLREPLFQALLSLQRIVRGAQGFDPSLARREFAMSATDFLQLLFLPQLVDTLSREAPAVQLRVRTVPIHQYARMLESGELDLMVGSLLLQGSSGIMSRELGQERMACAARAGHPALAQGLSLDVYTRLAHILISPSGSGPGIVDQLLASRGRSRRIAVRLSSFLIAPWVVARTDHLLTAPARVLEAYRDVLGIQIFDPPLEIASVPITLLWHESTHVDPAHQWMRERIARAYRDTARAERSPRRVLTQHTA
jgi:DNA-binding transcriptional LysR family regulator